MRGIMRMQRDLAQSGSVSQNGAGTPNVSIANLFQDNAVGGPSKRIIDIVLAFCSIIVLFPALTFIAILILIVDRRPIIIRQSRIGRGGATFWCFKYRTMIVDSDEYLRRYFEKHPTALMEWQSTRKLKCDPRITALGRALRRMSLDELPQLYNIIKGEMSFVGPRPIVAEEIEKYGSYFSDYICARPGLTGIWQTSGRNEISYETRVALDSEYVRNWSLRADVVILLRTIPAVISFPGC
jgi:exopolysaccharide production protein ExoY